MAFHRLEFCGKRFPGPGNVETTLGGIARTIRHVSTERRSLAVNTRRTRRRFLALAGVATTGTLGGCLDGFRRDRGEAAFSARLEERVPELLDRYEIPGASLALIEDGAVVWTGADGESRPEEGRPMTTDTLCRPQSITKSVTAWGVMTLVEAGAIDLDDPIDSHVTSWDLPESAYSWDGVTVRRLLSHSTGLPAGGYDNITPGNELPSIYAALDGEAGGPVARPVDEPGTFRYSNPGYVLLELLIEDVTGVDYAEYMQDAVLDPLGMEDSTFEWSDRVESNLITEHFVDGEPVPQYREPVRAHGMLYATAADVARFVAASMPGADGEEPGPDGEEPGRGILDPASVEELHTPVVETTGFYALGSDGAGLGHFVETLGDGERAVTHGGQGTGSWSWFHAVPETGDGIVILTNSERSLQFIGDVVGEWADSRGLSSVGVSRAVRWSRVPIWTLWVVVAWLGYRLFLGLRGGTRKFAPTSSRSRLSRAVLGGVGLLLLGAWWGVVRQTLGHFVPVYTEWLGVVLSVVAVLLLVTAMVPRTADDGVGESTGGDESSTDE